jgi:hypothetical protein
VPKSQSKTNARALILDPNKMLPFALPGNLPRVPNYYCYYYYYYFLGLQLSLASFQKEKGKD